MNALLQAAASPLGLVDIIELKWLLAAHGVHVHVEQLQFDAEYARALLDRAASIPNPALHETAARVRRGLNLDPGSPAGSGSPSPRQPA